MLNAAKKSIFFFIFWGGGGAGMTQAWCRCSVSKEFEFFKTSFVWYTNMATLAFVIRV